MNQPRSIERGIATGLVAIMALLQFVNVARVIADPVGFASYMGLPQDPDAALGFVYVYALRTFFIAALVTALLVLKRFDTLLIIAVIAVALPVGDAILATNAGAQGSIVLRHVAIAAYIIVAAYFLWRVRDHSAGVNSPRS